MYAYALAIGALFASSVVSSPAASYAVKERHVVPRGWAAVAPAPASHHLSLNIGLKHRNQDKLERHVIEISDPTHSRYGKHMSAEEVSDLIKPSDETVDSVTAWLSEHGISSAKLNDAKDTITVMLPVSKVEDLLQTKYSVFRHEDGTQFVRAPEWSLPVHLHQHIDIIQPTTSFFRPFKNANTLQDDDVVSLDNSPSLTYPSLGGDCDIRKVCNATGTNLSGKTVNATTLQCLRCLYGTYYYKPLVPKQNSIGITNYLNNTVLRADLKKFLTLYRPDADAGVADTFPVVIINNGPDSQTLSPADVAAELDLEPDLDAEMVVGISYPTSFMAWNTGGEPPFNPDLNTPTDTNEPYLTWLQYVLAQKKLPNVISTSYGDDEQTVPLSYALKVCDGFKQLAARGITLFFSSGDSGVGANGTCVSNTDGKRMFIPAFPASCPWVTSVGATQGYLPEAAVTRFGSGAGFSNYFGSPAYQTSAVQGYLSKIGNLYQGLYNRTGRAYPDVAAQGNHDVIVWNNMVTTIGGSSASSPTFAAVIALVNDALIAAGRPPLGFINPWLYGGAYRALNDITIGSSIGCDTAGFPAATGWDPVTGFGTPNFGPLVAAAFLKGYFP